MEMLPNDVRQHRFRKGVRGYAADEVEQFLEHIATVLEDALQGRQKAEEQVKRLEKEMQNFRDQEGALKKAVLTVEQAMAQTRDASQREVESIKREAEIRAVEIVHEAEVERRSMEQDLRYLKDARQNFIDQFRAFCRAQLTTLDNLDHTDRARTATREAVQPADTGRPSLGSRPKPPPAFDEPKPAQAPPRQAKPWIPEPVDRENAREEGKLTELPVIENEDQPVIVFPPPLVPEQPAKGES